MENKQTAIDWLVKQVKLGDKSFDEFFRGEIEQAKQMEKEQIKDAYNNGHTDGINIKEGLVSGTIYYNETYGK